MFAAFAFQQRCLLLVLVATNNIFLPDAAIFQSFISFFNFAAVYID
jgi:hypothetical protein